MTEKQESGTMISEDDLRRTDISDLVCDWVKVHYAEVRADALEEAADDIEEFCYLNHSDGPPCTCFVATKNLRNRVCKERGGCDAGPT